MSDRDFIRLSSRGSHDDGGGHDSEPQHDRKHSVVGKHGGVGKHGVGDENREVRIAIEVPQRVRYVEGHFPGNPILPGIAQLVPLAEALAEEQWPDLGGVESVRRLKFMHALRPGDRLDVVLSRPANSPNRVMFRIERSGTECTRGTLLFRSAGS